MSQPKFKVTKNLTLPFLKLVENVPYYLQFSEPMFLGKKLKTDDKKEPATLANVVNLETGELMQIICATVLRENLNESYPNDSYVDKSFCITGHRVFDKTDPTKLKYNTFSIAEVEVDTGDETPAPVKKVAK